MLSIALILSALLFAQSESTDRLTRTLQVMSSSEVAVTVRAGCARCSWGAEGREGVALRVSVDGRYSQHLMLTQGEGPADYTIALGRLEAGTHQLLVERDPALSASGAGPAVITVDKVSELARGKSDDYIAWSMAPVIYARPNTVGKFTDVPLLMWYEVVPTARGRQFRYSVIFSNEDGGTATDRLMATWGRTTDIEFVYGAELDAEGRVIAEEFQGPGHEVPAFKGRHEGAHPLLWVSTDNNMVSESGPTAIRYAPVPERYDLRDRTREVVMDDHPWTYAITAAEMTREGKIANDAAAGSGKIPDLRRYVHVEACTDLQDAAVAFAVQVIDSSGTARWYESDRGLPEFRIVRSGCFQAAVPLPETRARIGAIRAVRFRAYPRPPADGRSSRPSVILTRVNRIFMLDDAYLPGASMFSWIGSQRVPLDGAAIELPFK